jgi:hypothetical protein
MPSPDGRADAKLSDERIDAAPPALKALFQEYDFFDVTQALDMVGMNDDPTKFTPEAFEAGMKDARLLLEAETRRRMETKFSGA